MLIKIKKVGLLDPNNFPPNDPNLRFILENTHKDLLTETERLINAL